MIADMPRRQYPYLYRKKSRHKTDAWYVRQPGRPMIRLRATFGSDAFTAEYGAAISRTAPTGEVTGTGSIRWLWARYIENHVWKKLSQATKDQRTNIMVHVLARCGDDPYSAVNKQDIERGKEDRASTPSQARNYIDTMRGMFRWAKGKHRKTDPTEGVKYPKRPRTNGFPAWTEADVGLYQAKYPLGTRERVWLDVLLYTGPRRGDAVQIGRQHICQVLDPIERSLVKAIVFKTEKSGGMVEITRPYLPILERTIEAGPCGAFAFICGANGKRLTKESFGNMFSAATRAAGVQKSAHGVRKIAATIAANNGATIHQLMALFGWKSPSTAEPYTREADRRRLAMGSAGLIAIEPPSNEVAQTPEISLDNQKLTKPLVRSRRLELPRVAPLAPQASASTVPP